MSTVSRITTWWKAVTRPARFQHDVADELAFHIETYADDLMRRGLSRDEALRRARVELGGVAAQSENCRAAWGTRAWDELRADIRYALRMLGRSPGFAAIAIVSLALGIGANTVIFTITRGILLDRLAVPHPEELRLFAWTQGDKGAVHDSWGYFDKTPSGRTLSTSFSYPVYEELRRRNRTIEDVFAFKNFGRLTATVDKNAEAVTSELVSGNYYHALQVIPALGRPILESDDAAPGREPVIVISDGYWSRRFGRSPSVIGKTIQLNSTSVTIIGVNPPGFTGAYSVQNSPDIFLPFSMQPIVAPKWKASLLEDKELWWVLVMGRLKSGVSTESARAAFDVVLNDAVRSTTTVGKDGEIPRLELEDGSRGQNDAGERWAKPVHVLMLLAGFVLLLACANLANLLLARAGARQREMSVRLALGAGRGRILRRMFTEALLLSLAGGAAGLVLGYLGRNFIPRLLAPAWKASPFRAHFDWKIFAFTAAVSVLTGLLFGLAPAWQSTRAQVSSGLKNNAQTSTQRTRNLTGKAIVVVQVSLSMLLLVGAGLFARTLRNLDNGHLGFRPENVLLFEIQPPRTHYPYPRDIALYHELEERLAIPGVDSVTLSYVPLLSGSVSTRGFARQDQSRKEKDSQIANVHQVGEHFFSTLGIPILAGRGFNATDTETSRKVTVVNQQMVKKFFPDTNPIGKTILSNEERMEVIGISGDAKYGSLRQDPPPTFYLPYRQLSETKWIDGMTFEVRTRIKPEAMIPALRSAVQSVDKDLPLLDIRTQEEQIADNAKQERLFASLTGGFGVLALILSCIGIYGIMAYAVSRRINEIGIRMALGAQSGKVLGMVLGEASWLTLMGVGAGLMVAIGMGRFVASMLYGLKPYDPLTPRWGRASAHRRRARRQLVSSAPRRPHRSHPGTSSRMTSPSIAGAIPRSPWCKVKGGNATAGRLRATKLGWAQASWQLVGKS